MREFAAEQYLSGADADAAERRASVARLAAERLTREGTPIEFVRSIFIPEDETCIYIYRADSIQAVQQVAARASLRFERVSEALTETGHPRTECGQMGLSDENAERAGDSRHGRRHRGLHLDNTIN
jgi:hypothetical protein